jgi:hypothetical protein
MFVKFSLTGILPFFVVLLVIAFPARAIGADWTVTNLLDRDTDVCGADCSFREAINVAAVGDTIIFSRNIRGGTIQLTKTLDIKRRLIIDGPNVRRITVKGDGTFRIFEMHAVVTIDGLIIKDGNAGTKDGGGINATGTVNLTNVGLLNNSAAHGGAIAISGGNLWIANSLISENTATSDGGGGGIDSFSPVSIRIVNTTISGNRSLSTADGAGGVRIVNPTDWLITTSTIVHNTANGTNSIITAGGLVALDGRPGGLRNSILALNTGINPDFIGRGGASYSVVGITRAESGIINGANGNVVGSADSPVDPMLGALIDNGGGLQTYALLGGSPAIDGGNNTVALDRSGHSLSVDQRGYDRFANSTVDMGAYEYNSQPVIQHSTIVGQVIGQNGRGVSAARVVLRDSQDEDRIAITNPFGYFRFQDLQIGRSYDVSCFDKRESFPTQPVLIEETIEKVKFVAK